VIATGSRPYRPPDVDFSHPRILDSDTVLGLDHTPQSVTIYGAGVVGCEYASIFRGLDVKVNLINNRDKLLSFLDDEIIDALSYHLRDQGVLIRHNETYSRIEGLDDGVVVHLKSGKKIRSDVLLWANGRTGNTQDLGLEHLGIVANGRGQIDVDESYRTTVSDAPTSTPSATWSASPASPAPPTTRAASPRPTCSPATATSA
jgi:NAD(P) transhydrogenase